MSERPTDSPFERSPSAPGPRAASRAPSEAHRRIDEARVPGFLYQRDAYIPEPQREVMIVVPVGDLAHISEMVQDEPISHHWIRDVGFASIGVGAGALVAWVTASPATGASPEAWKRPVLLALTIFCASLAALAFAMSTALTKLAKRRRRKLVASVERMITRAGGSLDWTVLSDKEAIVREFRADR